MSGSRVGNTFWDEESSNKGVKLMKMMGWDQGKGLGKDEQGSTNYVRTKVKNNTEGTEYRDFANLFDSKAYQDC
jgi:hypothetical protein